MPSRIPVPDPRAPVNIDFEQTGTLFPSHLHLSSRQPHGHACVSRPWKHDDGRVLTPQINKATINMTAFAQLALYDSLERVGADHHVKLLPLTSLPFFERANDLG